MATTAITEQEFNEWSNDLKYIILDCHISIKNFEALLPFLHKSADWQPISGFLDHLRTQYYFTLVTQLTKLFWEGAHSLRFTALMQRLQAPPLSPFIRDRFLRNSRDSMHAKFPQFWKSEKEMREGMKLLKRNIQSNKTVIERLGRCRNEVIAHTDNIHQRSSAEQSAPSVSELKVLAEVAADSYNRIQAGLGLGSFTFDATGSWDIEMVFRGWSGYIELHNLKGELMRMGYAAGIKLDQASFKLKVDPLP